MFLISVGSQGQGCPLNLSSHNRKSLSLQSSSLPRQATSFSYSSLCTVPLSQKSLHAPEASSNLGTPGFSPERSQIPLCNTPSLSMWSGQRLQKTQILCVQNMKHCTMQGQHLSIQRGNSSLPFTVLQSCLWHSWGTTSYLIKLILSAKICVSSLVGVTFSTKAIPYRRKFCRNSFSPSSVSRKLWQSTEGTWAWR